MEREFSKPTCRFQSISVDQDVRIPDGSKEIGMALTSEYREQSGSEASSAGVKRIWRTVLTQVALWRRFQRSSCELSRFSFRLLRDVGLDAR